MKTITVTIECDINKIREIAYDGFVTEGYLIELIYAKNKEEEFMTWLSKEWKAGDSIEELHQLLFVLTEQYADEIEDFMNKED